MKKTKEIAIVLGGGFGLYSNLFKEIDKKFNCKIMRTSPFNLKVKINDTDVKFYICNSPVRDKNYASQKKWLQSSQWKELMPPPANEAVRKIGKPNVVLFFGYCGTFKGRKSIYAPESFKEIFFKEDRIMKVNELEMKVENEIKIENILKPTIISENTRVITSNLVLAPHREKPESKNKVIKIANILYEFGDVVEKESYQIVKYFNKKVSLGVYLQASDVLTNKRHMLSHRGMEIDRKKFNRNVIKAIKYKMSNIKFSKKLFEKEIGKLDEKMQDRISMFGTPLEGFNDEEIEIEVFPNRPDMLSYQGFKRSFLAFLGKKTGIPKYKINSPEKNFKVIVDSSVKDVRPYTVCAIVKKLKFDDDRIKELIDIQEKLHITLGRKRKKFAIGVYPLEKITLPITYKALEPDKIKFIPLEMNREMSGLQILQRHSAGRDYAHLLAGKEKFPIFEDAGGNVLSMPPIINSQLTGKVTEKTKDIFVECSGFDFDALKKCLNILVSSLADMGGEIYQMEVAYKKKEITPDFSFEKNKISLENANKLLGLNLNDKQIKQFLERMGHNYSKGNAETPSWRTDILHENDLIEDIAIAYGYENFVPEIPEISTIGEEDTKEKFKRKISEILVGLNMLEISNYHLTTKRDQFTKMGISEKQEKDFIEVEGSKTDYTILRKNLAHYIMKIFSENVDSEYPQKIFEIGRVFELNNSKIIEKENLAMAFASGNFTDLKQVLEYLLRMIGMEIKLEEPEGKEFPGHFIDGRVAKIIFNEKIIGYFGEIHPRILKNWKIKMPVALCEICLDDVFEKILS